MGEVKNFLAQHDEIHIRTHNGGRKTLTSAPILWDEIEGTKIAPIKVFNHDEIAAYQLLNPEPPKPYPWRSRSRRLERISSKKS